MSIDRKRKAADRERLLSTCSVEDLREWVYESYKDIHGIRGRSFLTASAEECADWIVSYFQWDEANGFWSFTDEARSLVNEET